MTILNEVNQMSSDKAKAVAVAKIISDSHAALLAAFQQAVWLVWGDDNPQAVIDELGTNAVSVFLASQAAAVCLESVAPGCTTDILAARGTYTAHEDGTITDAVKPPQPEPEPE